MATGGETFAFEKIDPAVAGPDGGGFRVEAVFFLLGCEAGEFVAGGVAGESILPVEDMAGSAVAGDSMVEIV